MPTDDGDDTPAGQADTDVPLTPSSADSPTDEDVVETAASAATTSIFSRFKQSRVRDFDVTVTFEDDVLSVDVYLNVPSAVESTVDEAADEAARTARSAVDELLTGGEA